MVNPVLFYFMCIVSFDKYDIDLLNFEKLETALPSTMESHPINDGQQLPQHQYGLLCMFLIFS